MALMTLRISADPRLTSSRPSVACVEYAPVGPLWARSRLVWNCLRHLIVPWLPVLVCLHPALAHAQAHAQARPQEGQAAPSLEPPKAVTETTVAYPDHAPEHAQPIIVRVKLRVGADGHVTKVDLLSPPQAVFDDAVLRAAEKFLFLPARYGGKPVPVEITFSHTFLPPPPPPAPTVDGGPPLVSTLRGKLVEKGTRVPVQGATVSVQIGERHYDAPADTRGRFRVAIPAGQARITVHAVGYKAFLQVEKVDE